MKILLHSSKTMKPEQSALHAPTTPRYMNQATRLVNELQNMNSSALANLMGISSKLAATVEQQIHDWNNSEAGAPAALTFRGDIYSGLSAAGWDAADAAFAQENLLIMSGLYGLLRPFDTIKPYRLEMGCKLMVNGLVLDKFWEKELIGRLHKETTYVNLTAYEYFKVLKEQLSGSKVVSPKFLTLSTKTGEPEFVTVHAKIARGSFANWLIKNKIDDVKDIIGYDVLNYHYDKNLSNESEPVFVCEQFGGLGLSVRLS